MKSWFWLILLSTGMAIAQCSDITIKYASLMPGLPQGCVIQGSVPGHRDVGIYRIHDIRKDPSNPKKRIANPQNGVLTITPRTATLTILDRTYVPGKDIYYWFSMDPTSMINRSSFSVVYSTTAPSNYPAGQYPITGKVVADEQVLKNYVFVVTPGTLTVK